MMGRTDMFQRETSKPKSVGTTLARFWHYFSKYRLALLGVAVLVIIGTWAQVEVPDLIGQAVDCFITPATQQALSGSTQAAGAAGRAAATNCWYAAPNPQATTADFIAGLGGLVLWIVLLQVLGSVLAGLQFYLMAYAGQNALRVIRIDVFSRIQSLSLGYFSKHEAGDVMSRITNDADAIQQSIGFPLVGVVQGVLLMVWIAFNMLTKSWGYALVSLVTVPVMFAATLWFSGQARKAYRKVRQSVGDVNANLQESISAVREAQAFNRGDENIAQFNESNAASRDANIRAVAFTSALSPTLEALGYVSVAIVAGVGGMILLSGQNLFGTVLSIGLNITFIT